MNDKSVNVKKNKKSNSPYIDLPVMYAVARTIRVILQWSCSVFTGVYKQKNSGGRRKWNLKDWCTGRIDWSNRSIVLNQSPRICSIKVSMQHKQKLCWCTIMHETHILVHSNQYSLPGGYDTENKDICVTRVLIRRQCPDRYCLKFPIPRC